MSWGISYDSDQGRSICAALTSIMTGISYATSAEIAGELGPFPKYNENANSMLKVIRNHKRASEGKVMKEIESNQNAILFIDEIHTIIGAGATSGGAMDASNLLKPALQNGGLKCIGSTTYKEYRGYFDKDRALVRRFQKI